MNEHENLISDSDAKFLADLYDKLKEKNITPSMPSFEDFVKEYVEDHFTFLEKFRTLIERRTK